MAIIQGNTKVAAAGGYSIQQSARFNRSDSAYLTRTFASDGGDTWTLSVWIKRGQITSGNNQYWFSEAGGSGIGFVASTDTLRLYNGSTIYNSTPVYRDTSAWYHIVFSNNSGTWVCYVNGETVSGFTGTAANFNRNNAWSIGQYQNGGGNYFDGYMADFYWVSGTAETADAFAETNADGVWVPKAYAGSLTGNSFHLDFSSASSLGDDSSGNNNDFTSSGLTAADQVSDSPTDNFSTMNALGSGFAVAGSIADGNLQVTTGTAIEGEWYFGTQRLQGNVYWEVYINSIGNSRLWCGVGIDGDDYAHAASDHWMIYSFNGTFYDQGSAGKTSSAISATSTLQFAFSEDNDALWVGVDGTWLYSATQAEIEAFTTTNKANSTSFGGVDLFPVVGTGSSTNVVTYNFGQTAFTHTKPTGYSAVSTANLPDPTIADPSAYFQTTLYTGNGTAIGSGGNAVTQIGNSTFQPDFVWMKSRSAATDHALYDAVRGTTKEVISNSAAAESTLTEGLTTFGAAGFTVGSDAAVNTNTATYAAWQWLAANGTASNTDGSVTSTVSNNSTSNFSIVKYTGTGSGSPTVGHGLGVTPDMIIIKHLGRAQNWRVFHTSEGVGKTGFLNSTAAFAADPDRITAVSSTTFTAAANMNESADYIAYCFAEVEGFSKFGSYTGNGSSDGVFVHTDFEVGFLMYKRTNAAESWEMYDNTRGFNVHKFNLRANLSNAEQSDIRVDLLSNGFKARSSNTAINASGSTYIYMAFASSPFKTATAQ